MKHEIVPINQADARSSKRALEFKLNELLRNARDHEDLQIEPLADPLDQVMASTDREMAVRRLDHQTRLIHQVESALARIESGDYGRCDSCEEPISRKRLNAVPWATRCVACQSRAEAESDHGDLQFRDAA